MPKMLYQVVRNTMVDRHEEFNFIIYSTLDQNKANQEYDRLVKQNTISSHTYGIQEIELDILTCIVM